MGGWGGGVGDPVLWLAGGRAFLGATEGGM